MPVGMVPIMNAIVVTELEALELLTGVEAIHVASGGVGGSEGAVTLAVDGESEDVEAAIELVKSIKGEPPVKGLRQDCASCKAQCYYRHPV